MSDWCTIESDPGVFTELIENFGVKNVQVEELYSLDEASLSALKPVYGLIFLFKWLPTKDERPIASTAPVFFAKQVITNACATQAILNLLFNVKDLPLGESLSSFKEITSEFTPEMRGLSMTNSDTIKNAHNSFARPEPFAISNENAPAEDAFHFVTYVPVGNELYELDGLKEGPISVGTITDDNWLSLARETLEKRIATYGSEIRFNLMAVVENRKEFYSKQIEALLEQRKTLEGGGDDAMEVDDRGTKLSLLDDKIEQLRGLRANEEAKHAHWKAENIRRKHNYIPFLFNLLKILAKKDLLMPLVDQAKEKELERRKAAAEKK
eukprot:TRINITY_DN384_c0_g1_i1.p1 TRINITY_DN384_c0_g1~~TRINITY_DN384_c0_g1_i1.p1  ORF type:complete len:325 (-),score=81.46 TRINITY_DN384_c0_g1_i1:95-1069(-)